MGIFEKKCPMTNPVFLWLSWLPCVLILTFINTHFASSKCLNDQQSLLLQLKRSLVFDHSKSTKLVTWNTSLDCCEWSGVHCDDSTGHVIGIDLSGESITDSSDNLSSLFSLQFLQSLNLANNSLTNAQIPSGIGKLSSLIYLNLSNAGYSGQVPFEISKLVKLEILDLSSLSYFGFLPTVLENPSLALLIRDLTKIRELHLDGVVISANASEWSKAVSSLPNLQVLSMSNCNLSGDIDSSLGMLRSLSVIRLDQNNLAAPVPSFIANFRNLTQLKLSDCQLKGIFPQQILQVPTLRSLDLAYNELLEGTLPEFPKNGSLQTLVLSFTKFSGSVPVSISHLKQLRRIALTNCGFHGLFPHSIDRLYHLEYLDLSQNLLSGPMPSFSSMKNLTYLGLGNNMLSGTLASTDWANLLNLVYLDLSNNRLKGSIPMQLFSLPSLQKVQLSQNDFSGKLGEFSNISSSILDTLDLTSNNLEGPIPNSLFRLKGLKVLSLSFNNFAGYLKLNEIQQLRNLSTLELSHNNLLVDTNDSSNNFFLPQFSTLKLGACNLTVLPEFLRNQSRLQYLDLSDNHIQGRIPTWIWTVGNHSLAYLNLSCNNFFAMELPLPDTPNLAILDIHSNNLHGEIPPLSSPIPTYLDYSKNGFTSISPNIGDHLSSAYFLSLSGNNISGDIPESLCKANFLRVLDLSDNLLNGRIPHCVIRLSWTLGVLNLRGNQLGDTIPDVFPENCSLNTIDFGGNSLQGQFPKSLAKCKQLEVLDLGRNQLRDTFPSWVMNVSNLRVLVLRANKFYGPITCPLNNTWPVLQIVDLASNNFNGELRAECLSKLTALMAGRNNSQPATHDLQYSFLSLDHLNYQNMVVVTIKGSELQFRKILTLLQCIDLSSNQFEGKIPDVIGNLKTVISLNLSHNTLSGTIPPSIRNLSTLEALDLSHNNLSGAIPIQLGELTFLAVLNLAYNKLEGKIPTSTQLQSFDDSSYIGNEGLCGPPLRNMCTDHNGSMQPTTPSAQEENSSPAAEFDWQFILLGVGFGTGAGLVISPFMFWKKGRKWMDEQTDNLASAILSAFEFCYAGLEQGILGSEEDVEHLLFEIRYDENDDEDELEDRRVYGRYCLFCSKLDMERRRVVHNLGCTCHGSPWISSLSLSK